MAECETCGAVLSARARFCPRCGRATGLAPEEGFVPVPVSGVRRGARGSWKSFRRLGTFYGALLLLNLLGGLAWRFTDSPWLDVTLSALFVGLTLAWLRVDWRHVAVAFQATRKRLNALPLVLVATGLVLFLNLYFAAFKPLGLEIAKASQLYLKAGWPLWSAFLLVSVEPGIIEEVAFRGLLQTRLSQLLSRNEALIIQAVLFSVLHLGATIFISHFLMGLFLGWVRERTGQVYAGMALHMGWNAWVLLSELAVRTT
jgi:membrane protease YdiL (CAAX protease family)